MYEFSKFAIMTPELALHLPFRLPAGKLDDEYSFVCRGNRFQCLMTFAPSFSVT